MQSYLVNEDYQPEAEQLTFQWNVPAPTSFFNSFIVSVADSKGNGNSSGVLSVGTGSDSKSNCQPYSATSAFNYAGDSQTGEPSDRYQCGSVRYYPVQPPFRGTAPFSITLVPLHDKPITVDIPSSAEKNDTFFIYNSEIPLKSGTQFYQFLSDATGGGSGGGSIIYTVSPSSNDSCLSEDYKLRNENSSNPLPYGQFTALYANLPGAIDDPDHKDGGSNVGGLVGGIIGAVIGVCGILLLIGLYIIYRRRQKRKLEAERKEQPQFIDLDDDDNADPLPMPLRSGRDSRHQSYQVSPFTYEPAPQAASEEGIRNEVMHYHDQSSGPSTRYPPSTHGGASPFLTPPHLSSSMPFHSQEAPRPGSAVAGTESELVSLYSGGPEGRHRTASNASGSAPGGHNPNQSFSSGRYVLRTRNTTTDDSNQDSREAPALPRKTELYPGASDDHDGSLAAARLMQHTDGGPLTEELPPSYGNWNRPSASASRRDNV